MKNLLDTSYVCFNEGEFFENIFSKENLRIERIVSFGHNSPKGFWYDQDEWEWVVLLQGAAKLKFYNGNKEVELKVGDAILIEPHEKHRVEWTTPESITIWLAVFFK